MRKPSGRLYFYIVGIISVLYFFFAFNYVTAPGHLAGVAVQGIVLGLILAETIVLISFPILMTALRRQTTFRFPTIEAILTGKPVTTVSSAKEALATKFVKKLPFLKKLSDSMEKRIVADVMRSGIQMDPYSFATLYSFYAVIAAMVFVPVAVALSILISPTLLALMLIPLIVFYTPELNLKNKVAERKTNVKDELPFFTLMASIMQSSGRTLYDAFKTTIGKALLPAMEVEARLIQKSMGFGREIVGAINDVASTHPDDVFKHLLYGYTSVLKSGGDTVLYLTDRTKEYLGDMRFRWQSYSEKVGTIGEMLIIVFILLPLLLVISAITMPPDMVALVSYTGTASLPVLAILIYFAIKQAQPKTYDIVNGDARLGIVGGVVAGIAASITGELWMVLAVGLAVGTALYGFPVRAQLKEIKMTEAALPDFLRNIAEYRKIGYDMRKSILETASKTNFNPVFDAMLSKVSTQMRLGAKLDEVRVQMRSWLGRMAFFILNQISESGGGTPQNVEDLYNFISSYNRLRKEAVASISLYKMIGFMVPVAIPVMVKMIGGIIGSFSTSAAGFLGGGATSLAIINSTVALITVVSAAAIAFTMSRATDFTWKNTFNITILLVLAVVAIVLTQYMPTISLGLP